MTRRRLLVAVLSAILTVVLLGVVFLPLLESKWEAYFRRRALEGFLGALRSGHQEEALAWVVSAEEPLGAPKIALDHLTNKHVRRLGDVLARGLPAGCMLRVDGIDYVGEPEDGSVKEPWWSPFEFSRTTILGKKCYKVQVVQVVDLRFEGEKTVSVCFDAGLLMVKVDGDWCFYAPDEFEVSVPKCK